MKKRILVLAPPEDRAGRAVALAGEVARRIGARVSLLRALDEGLRRSEGEAAKRMRTLLRRAEQERVESLAETLRAEGLEVDVEVSWGVPWQVALERVEREGADLLVKPASGVGQAGRVFFGSTALHLFRRCPCPIWVVGEDGRLPERVWAAVDPLPAGGRRAIAHAVLDWAETVSAWRADRPTILSAWQAPGAEWLGELVDDPTLAAYVRDSGDRAAEGLEALVAERRDAVPPERVELREGAPADVLAAATGGRAGDLLVMGTLGRPDEIGDLIGETAETILRQVRCSVLTVPGPGAASVGAGSRHAARGFRDGEEAER